jgi:hypothetical protein
VLYGGAGPVALEMCLRAQAVFPSFLLLDSTCGRRSSVASPVESATSAGSNSRLAMQGRDDRETRSTELIACNGQKRRDVRARAICTKIRAESRIEWINQCSVVMNGGADEVYK